jgi:hypothetical protein
MSAAQSVAGPTSLCTPSLVRIFHNNDFRAACSVGYQAGHSVTEVFVYTTARTTASDDDTVLLAAAYDLLNVKEDPAFGPPDPRAVDYRLCRNRSLSVGDIVAVDGRFYACEPSGWQALQHAPRIDQRTTHGTTPLYESAAPARRRTIRDLGTVLRGAAAARWADLGRRVRALRVGHAAAAAGHGRVLRRRRR